MIKRRGGGLLRRWLWEIDLIAAILILVIMSIGIILITTASPPIAERIRLPSFYFVYKQLIFLGLALMLIIGISIIPEKALRKLSVIGFFTTIMLMAAVLFFGEEIKGARRWFSVFGISIQPSEFLKPFMCVIFGFALSEFNTKIGSIKTQTHKNELILGSLHSKRQNAGKLARYMSTLSSLFRSLIDKSIAQTYIAHRKQDTQLISSTKCLPISRYLGINADLSDLCIIMTIYLVAIIPLIMQPDFGMSASITIVTMGQLFIGGLSIILIASACILCIIGTITAYCMLPHVAHRINNFLHPEHSENYQVSKSLEAYLNGGLFGRGPGEGSVKSFLPDCHTDFIFAIAGEEFGGIASIIIMAVFVTFIVHCLCRLRQCTNLFQIYTCTGLLMHIAFQTIFNIGVTLHIFPTKGMTLPFISYGGSSTLSFAIIIGMYLNFTRKKYGNYKAKLHHSLTNNLNLIQLGYGKNKNTNI